VSQFCQHRSFSRLRALLTAGALLLLVCGRAWGHDESIPCNMELLLGRDRVTVELRFPIVQMVANDQQAAAAALPMGADPLPPVDYAKLDHLEVAKAHAQQMVDGLHLRYDNTFLKPKLLGVTVKDMVAGVSEDDLIPRPMGVYSIEFTPEHPIPPPKVFGMDHKLIKQPDDGSVITVMMMVSYKQENQEKSRYDVVDNEQNWSVNLTWPTGALAAAAPTSAAVAPTAGAPPAEAPATAPATQGLGADDAKTGLMASNNPDSSGRGYVYVALAFALALAGLAVVLLKRRPD
jgi:hypothetical protein